MREVNRVAYNLSAIQMVSTADPKINLETIKKLLVELSPVKNQLVLLPENVLSLADKACYFSLSEKLGEGYYQKQLADLANYYQCYLICGSFPIISPEKNRVYTTSLVFSPQGLLISFYHKIHLFDASVSDKKSVYKESDSFTAGHQVKVFDWLVENEPIKVGLAICYDLRFPALFQLLREQGAKVIVLAAAFTQVTGKMHWLPLLQARAIENQCYIVASNQGGKHLCGRETYGHSMIISPRGEVVKQLKKGSGSVKCLFDRTLIESVREVMPIISHNAFRSEIKK